MNVPVSNIELCHQAVWDTHSGKVSWGLEGIRNEVLKMEKLRIENIYISSADSLKTVCKKCCWCINQSKCFSMETDDSFQHWSWLRRNSEIRFSLFWASEIVSSCHISFQIQSILKCNHLFSNDFFSWETLWKIHFNHFFQEILKLLLSILSKHFQLSKQPFQKLTF